MSNQSRKPQWLSPRQVVLVGLGCLVALAAMVAAFVLLGDDDNGGNAGAVELAYLEQICAGAEKIAQQATMIPAFNEPPTDLTLEQRKARAASLFPALAALQESYLRGLESIKPPPKAAAVHEALVIMTERTISQGRRSIADLNLIFVSNESVEAHNARQRTLESAAYAAFDQELRRVPGLYTAFENLRCGFLQRGG